MKKFFHRGSKRKIGKTLAFAIFFGLNLGWVSVISPRFIKKDNIELSFWKKEDIKVPKRSRAVRDIEDRQITSEMTIRAPRDGSTSPCGDGCVSCASCPDLDAIRECICYLRTLMLNNNSCCEEVQSDLDQIEEDLDIIIECCDGVGSRLDECCENLSGDFRETWTVLERIDNKVFSMNDEVLVIDSKIDQLSADLETCCENLSGDFRETWTVLEAMSDNGCCDVIGLKADTLDPSVTPAAVLSVNDTDTFTVIQWLKAIYDKVK